MGLLRKHPVQIYVCGLLKYGSLDLLSSRYHSEVNHSSVHCTFDCSSRNTSTVESFLTGLNLLPSPSLPPFPSPSPSPSLSLSLSLSLSIYIYICAGWPYIYIYIYFSFFISVFLSCFQAGFCCNLLGLRAGRSSSRLLRLRALS